jgi:hypothetical protein
MYGSLIGLVLVAVTAIILLAILPSRLRRIHRGHEGHPLLSFSGEAGGEATRRDPELQRCDHRRSVQKGLGQARMALARKLGIRLWIMLRNEGDYHVFRRRGQKQQNSGAGAAGMPETR